MLFRSAPVSPEKTLRLSQNEIAAFSITARFSISNSLSKPPHSLPYFFPFLSGRFYNKLCIRSEHTPEFFTQFSGHAFRFHNNKYRIITRNGSHRKSVIHSVKSGTGGVGKSGVTLQTHYVHSVIYVNYRLLKNISKLITVVHL